MDRATMDALVRAMLFACVAIPATVIDLKCLRIPDVFSLGGLGCLSLLDLVRLPSSALWDGLAAVFAFCLFFVVRCLTNGLGLGDLKYAAMGAYYAGLPYWFLAIAVSAIAAMLFLSLAIVVFRKDRRMMIPFAPFLSIGALVAGAVKFATAN